MEKVVYLLGAGFSAPLGLPVMSNFLVRSKDLFGAQSDKYRHFEDVFKTIAHMHVCKSYFEADLFNIEEILSILEMREGLESTSEVRSFIKYIVDVIQYYTPPLTQPPPVRPGGWMDSIFGRDTWSLYGAFVGSLFNLAFSVTWPPGSPDAGVISFARNDNAKANYAVVSLNYDLILENLGLFLNERYSSAKQVRFLRDFAQNPSADKIEVPLAKLHGSADSGQIIAPTWNKSLHPKLVSNWKKAHELLADANHIRILGYSLPTTDAYIKYLLKSAVVNSSNLKRIDVICRGEVAKRNYDYCVRFNFYRFKDARLEDYLGQIHKQSMDYMHYGMDRSFDKLEAVHEAFMSN
jgi:hypothetical protein